MAEFFNLVLEMSWVGGKTEQKSKASSAAAAAYSKRETLLK